MKAILDYIQQILQQPRFGFQPALNVLTNTNESVVSKSNQSFFVAKDFAKQASYFFRIESSQEEETEVIQEEEEKKTKPKTAKTMKMVEAVNETKTDSQDLNYSSGFKYVFKLLIFPVIFCWIVLETAFEFIVDSDEEEISSNIETKIPASRENSYQPS